MKYTVNVFVIEDELAHKSAITKCLREFSTNSNFLELAIKDDINYLTLYHNINDLNFGENDIFIIDIHLNTSFTGIELAKKIRQKNPQTFILYLTSDETMSQRSINQQTFPTGYMVKDMSHEVISNEELFLFLKEIQNIILQRVGNKNIIEIKTRERLVLLNPQEIYYVATLSGVQKKTVVKTRDIEFIANERLIDIKKKLDAPYFILNLKSYIINASLMVSFNRLEGMVYFNNETELFVGSKQIDKIKKYLQAL